MMPAPAQTGAPPGLGAAEAAPDTPRPFAPAERIAGAASLVLAAAGTALVLYGIHLAMGPQQPVRQSLNPLDGQIDFNPEPGERLQFLTGLVLMPALLLCFFLAFRRVAGRLPEDAAASLDRRLEAGLVGGLLVLMAAGLIASGGFIWGTALNEGASRMGTVPVAAAAALAGALGAILLMGGTSPLPARAEVFAARGATLVAAVLIAMAGLFSVVGLHGVTLENIYLFSFNALFHGMVQVHLGRELLVDLNSIYGLYPHLIEPLFGLVGLSVFTFTALMSALNVVSFLLLFRMLRDLTSRRLIAGLAMGAMLYVCYFVGRQVYFDFYFQYHPLRFLFPALSVFLGARYVFRGGRVLYAAILVACSAGVLWNPDTGLVTLIAWVMTLALREVERRRFGRAAAHALAGALSCAAAVGLYSLAMRLEYGRFPDFGEFLHYQQLFYLKGYGMMPMTALHPWNMVILVYAAGLLYALMHLVRGSLSPKVVCVFHLSVLGTGLFSYYQGRSHDLNLIGVSYPAIILAAVFADMLLDGSRGRARPARPVLVGVLLFAFSFCLVDMVRIAPAFAAVTSRRLRPLVRRRETTVTRAARFVREHTRPGEEVLIVSYLSGVYHLESRTFSRRNLASFSESTMTGKGRLRFMMPTLRTFGKIFVAGDWDLDEARPLMDREFRLVAKTPDGYMALYAPR